MNVSELLIMLIVVSTAAIGLSIFIGGFNDYYNLNAENLSTLNKMSDISQQNEKIWSNASTAEAKTIGDQPYNIVAGVFGAISMVYNSVDLVQSMVSEMVSSATGLKLDFIKDAIISIVAIVILFTIFSAVMKWWI